VSSIWTPSGEHHPDEPGGKPGAADDVDRSEVEAELRQTRAELTAVPVADIVANHAVGLWQLAVLHLTPDPDPDGTPTPPRLAEASLAIDALGALVEGLADRLAPHDEALREALTQLRLAYVELSGRAASP
jgi:Domain of unknown function (DUF1844)